eukprot:g3123.t1
MPSRKPGHSCRPPANSILGKAGGKCSPYHTNVSQNLLTTMTSRLVSSLQVYWDLASEDSNERQTAVRTLLSSLEESQKSFKIAEDVGEEGERSEQSPAVNYALKRLTRGLGSSRADLSSSDQWERRGAQGDFEKNKREEDFLVPVASYLSLLFKNLPVTAKQSRAEKRDSIYGRAFGLCALARSRRRLPDGALRKVCKELLEWGRQKSHLAEISTLTCLQLGEAALLSTFRTELQPCLLEGVDQNEPSLWNPEQLACALFVRRRLKLTQVASTGQGEAERCQDSSAGKDLAWLCALTAPKTLHKLRTTLLSTARLAPRLHCVWELLLEDTCRAEQKGHEESPRWYGFWEKTLEPALFTGPHNPNRKVLGFRLFRLVLSRYILCSPTEPDFPSPFLSASSSSSSGGSSAVLLPRMLSLGLVRALLHWSIRGRANRTGKGGDHAKGDRALQIEAQKVREALLRAAEQSAPCGVVILQALRAAQSKRAELQQQADPQAVEEAVDGRNAGARITLVHATLRVLGRCHPRAVEQHALWLFGQTISALQSGQERSASQSIEQLCVLSKNSASSAAGKETEESAESKEECWWVRSTLRLLLWVGHFRAAGEKQKDSQQRKSSKKRRRASASMPVASTQELLALPEPSLLPTQPTWLLQPLPLDSRVPSMLRQQCSVGMDALLQELCKRAEAPTQAARQKRAEGENSHGHEEDEGEKEGPPSALLGWLESGTSHVWRLHEAWANAAAYGLELAVEWSEEAQEARAELLTMANRLRARMLQARHRLERLGRKHDAEGSQEQAKKRLLNALEQVCSLQLLCLHLGLLQLREAALATGLLRDTLKAQQELGNGLAAGLKGQPDEQDRKTWSEGVAVLVDVLLSVLAQPSALLRLLAKKVFAAWVWRMDGRALGDLCRVVCADRSATDSLTSVDPAAEEEDDEEEQDQEEEEEVGEEAEEQGQRAGAASLARAEGGSSDSEDSDAEAAARVAAREAEDERLSALEAGPEQLAEMAQYDLHLARMMQLRQDRSNQTRKKQRQAFSRASADFKLRALDLLEVFLIKQSSSPLVLRVCLEPLLGCLERAYRGEAQSAGQSAAAAAAMPSQLLQRLQSVFLHKLCLCKPAPALPASAASEPAQEDKDVLEQVQSRLQEEKQRSKAARTARRKIQEKKGKQPMKITRTKGEPEKVEVDEEAESKEMGEEDDEEEDEEDEEGDAEVEVAEGPLELAEVRGLFLLLLGKAGRPSSAHKTQPVVNQAVMLVARILLATPTPPATAALAAQHAQASWVARQWAVAAGLWLGRARAGRGYSASFFQALLQRFPSTGVLFAVHLAGLLSSPWLVSSCFKRSQAWELLALATHYKKALLPEPGLRTFPEPGHALCVGVGAAVLHTAQLLSSSDASSAGSSVKQAKSLLKPALRALSSCLAQARKLQAGEKTVQALLLPGLSKTLAALPAPVQAAIKGPMQNLNAIAGWTANDSVQNAKQEQAARKGNKKRKQYVQQPQPSSTKKQKKSQQQSQASSMKKERAKNAETEGRLFYSRKNFPQGLGATYDRG